MRLNDQARFLHHIACEGMIWRYGEEWQQDKTLLDRYNLEFQTIVDNDFTDYILNVWDLHEFARNPDRVIKFCEENDLVAPPDGIVPIGPGRGSVGGSIICYAINIHQVDPIRFNTFFERFINSERIAYPDIDFDISQKYRYIILKYLSVEHGEEKVAQIITFSTLSARSIVDELLKMAGVPEFYIKNLKDTLPDDPSLKVADFEENE